MGRHTHSPGSFFIIKIRYSLIKLPYRQSTWQALLAMSKQLYTLQPAPSSPLSLRMRDGDHPTTYLARNARRRGFPSYKPPPRTKHDTEGELCLQPAQSPLSLGCETETIQAPPSLETRDGGGFLPTNQPLPSPARNTTRRGSSASNPLARNARRRSSNHLPRSKRETEGVSFLPIPSPPSLETQHRGGAPPTSPIPSLARNARRRPSNHLPHSKRETEGVPFLPTPLARNTTWRGSFASNQPHPLSRSECETEIIQPPPSLAMRDGGCFFPTNPPPSLETRHRGGVLPFNPPRPLPHSKCNTEGFFPHQLLPPLPSPET